MTQTTTGISLYRSESQRSDDRSKTCPTWSTAAFACVRYGRLTIADGEDTFSFEGAEAGPDAHVRYRPTGWSDVAFRGSVGSGEPIWLDIGQQAH